MANSASDARNSELDIRRQLIEARAEDVMVSVGPNFFYTVTLPCTLWFFEQGKRTTPRADTVLFLDARHIFAQVDRAHREFTPQQIEYLANIVRLYRAILPDTSAGEFTAAMSLYVTLSKKIRARSPEPDISGVMAAIEKLLDASIASEGYVINDKPGDYTTARYIDLSQIDFDALRARFEHARQRALAQELHSAVEFKLKALIERNRMRMNYQERFERLIADCNAGSLNVQQFFDQLVVLASDLTAEDQRVVAESLTEEQLAIFDLLTRPNVTLSERDRAQVKRVARDLLETLKHEKLVLDWKKRQSARAAVQVAIRDVLDKELPEAYTRALYEQKCDQSSPHPRYLRRRHPQHLRRLTGVACSSSRARLISAGTLTSRLAA